ncbi:MAG TPA: metallophosphoesterase [Candidatus Saccharimonadales bacterium]|nr:metallophosphoesterase [Candidatus Saccharimonadales bacterium]
MKIAILSDFHIGYERFREDAFRQAEEALEAACDSADLLVIAGDIFDYRHPKPEVIAEAITLFKKVSSRKFGASVSEFEGRGKAYTDVPIVVIPGTHERRTDGEVDPIDLLNLAGLVVNANQARVSVKKAGEKVVVFGVGGTAEERFRDTLRRLDPRPVEGAFNLFLFHQSVYEFLPFSEDFIRMEELPKGFDLYVDGHIHNRVEAKCHGKNFLIPGSTVLTQLKEGEQEGKGFFIYDTVKDEYEFVRIKSRRFFMIRLDVGGMDPSEVGKEIEGRVSKVAGEGHEKPIIRVVLEGRLKDGFRSMDIGVRHVVDSYSRSAIVEITKAGIESEDSKDVEDLRSGMLESVSIRDYGMGIFLEKLKKNRYDMKLSPSALFDALSSDGKKEAVVKEAMELVLGS